ncbi:MAG: NAD(+)/NADH kinase [Candidatus Zixiibacteriota bacterium]
MRFGLIANLKRQGAEDAIRSFLDWSRNKNHELVLSHELKDIVKDHNLFCPREDLAREVEIVVSMGGDGTLLSAARSAGPLGTPLLGINLGSLGFLTPLSPGKLKGALDAIVAGNFKLDERMVLHTTINGQRQLPSPYALNDVVVDNGAVPRLLDIHLKVNGEDVVTYKSDGLIISTATGSTAYNLAVGGPIVHPKIEAMIVAPISSFSLTTRPMILSADDKLEMMLLSSNREATLALDGQVMIPLSSLVKVSISRADFRVKFITFPDTSYYQLLKSKLHWGISPYFT